MELPFIVIAGPTATGKTQTAVELALMLGGEVISADSMQIYIHMDIGTAKAAADEMKGVPHYLINERLPDEDYSAFIFQKLAARYAEDIRSRGKYPIICGGTGFYINALINGSEFTETETDYSYRESLYEMARDKGAETVHGLLAACDPQAAEAIHPNNVRRVVRALEYYRQTGETISSHNLAEREKQPDNAYINILTMDRSLLYGRINRRVDGMISTGLENEVRSLLDMGYEPGLASMQGLGYKEMARYIHSECSLDTAIEDIKTGTRRFAKRQLTWFSRQCQGTWRDVTLHSSPKALAESIIKDMGYK